MKSTSEILKKRRESMGMSQLYLAEKLGFGSWQFISNIERGVSMLPRKHINKACKLLRLNKDKFTKLWVREKGQRALFG